MTWDRRALPAGQSATKLTRFPWAVIAGQVNASHDAKRLLAVDLAANAVRVWPVADIGSADIVRAGAKLLSAQWRKGVASDISWVVGSNVDVFTYQTSTVATWYEGQALVTILAWRVDGSGIVWSIERSGDTVFRVDPAQVLPNTSAGMTAYAIPTLPSNPETVRLSFTVTGG